MRLLDASRQFTLGQTVKITSGLERLTAPNARYEIVRLLPASNPSGGREVFQYLLKEVERGRMRVAREDQIAPIGSAALRQEGSSRTTAQG
jgi:hypothetical protein